MGHIASAWETQVGKWIDFLNDPVVSIEKLTLGLASRENMTELRRIADAYGGLDVVKTALAAADAAVDEIVPVTHKSKGDVGVPGRLSNKHTALLQALRTTDCGQAIWNYLAEYV